MKRPKQKTLEQLEEQCAHWNSLYSVGMDVQYHPVLGAPEYRIRATKSPAQVLSGHTAVIWLEGERGCVSLDHCTPILIGIPVRKPDEISPSAATPVRHETNER